jgi:hypothetical protein
LHGDWYERQVYSGKNGGMVVVGDKNGGMVVVGDKNGGVQKMIVWK